jgi:VanZ family protein
MATPATFPLARQILRLHDWGTRHPLCYYTLPLLAWATFIAVASLVPSEDLPQLNFDFADKVEHVLCYAILGFLLLRGWSRQDRPTLTACLAVEVAAYTWGLYLEFLQRLTGYRTFDWWDAFADGVGALAGITLWLLVAHWLARKTRPDAPAPDQAPSIPESEN